MEKERAHAESLGMLPVSIPGTECTAPHAMNRLREKAASGCPSTLRVNRTPKTRSGSGVRGRLGG